jgi:hypothetical protein
MDRSSRKYLGGLSVAEWEELDPAERRRRMALGWLAARAEAAEYQLEQFQRTQRISSIANRLGFKDSEDAVRFLDDDDSDDDVTAERALKRLAREKPYLVDTRRSTGAPVGGEGSTLSMEEIKRMTPDEVNARWEEVQQAMQNQPAA